MHCQPLFIIIVCFLRTNMFNCIAQCVGLIARVKYNIAFVLCSYTDKYYCATIVV